MNQSAVEGGGEDFALIIGGKNQVGRSILVVPDVGVVQVDFPHLIRRFEQADGFQIRTDLENPRARKGEIGFLFARPAVDGKAAMSVHQHFLGFGRKVVGGVKHFEFQVSLAADARSASLPSRRRRRVTPRRRAC